MKVLFVCRQNVGRSQMAKAFYNSLTHTHDADAAGTDVKEIGQTLLERKQTSTSKNFYLLDVMNDSGYDLSQEKRQRLDKQSLNDYDWVISMASPSQSPDWLLSAPNYVFWDVEDPRGQDYEVTARIRDEILKHVQNLIAAKNIK